MSDSVERIRLQFLTRGALGARDLARALGVSQPTVSRALGAMGSDLVRIGRGPRSRYGLAAPIGGLGHSWPLYQIDPLGSPREIGILHSLAASAWWLESASRAPWPSLTAGEFPDGIFPGFPWFLDDLRPQGFLGRSFARRHGLGLGVGTDPAEWPERAVVESLLRFGAELPGAFVLGGVALAEALRSRNDELISAESRPEVYPRLAAEALAGGLPKSSAGGEQPKFTATLTTGEGLQSVIVKFSPPLGSPEGRRWADLLAAEAIASEVLAEAGFATARTGFFDAGGRRFLEVERFDRTSSGGRISCVSLRAHDAAFFGEMNTPWTGAALRLRSHGWLDAENAARLASLWRFGRLIANTDMHYGNVSLVLAEHPPLRLAPVYDMLPMAYRPGPENAIPDLSKELLELARTEFADCTERATAGHFWTRVADSEHISSAFRAMAATHAETLQ